MLIDWQLVAGAALFGAGWGLAGMCPGPTVVSAGALRPGALVLLPAMLAGMAAFRAATWAGLLPEAASRDDESARASTPGELAAAASVAAVA